MDGARILCLCNKLGDTSEASGGGGPSESSKVKVDCMFRAKSTPLTTFSKCSLFETEGVTSERRFYALLPAQRPKEFHLRQSKDEFVNLLVSHRDL